MEIFKVCLLFVLLPSLTLACGCAGDILSVNDTLKRAFCSSAPVYAGRVVAATCNCAERGPVFACQEYRLDAGGAAENVSYDSVNRVFCAGQRYDRVDECFDTLVTVAGGRAIQNFNGDLPAPTNDTDNPLCGYACPFSPLSKTHNKIVPCQYTIQVMETFNGNADFMVGDNVTMLGPTRCYTNPSDQFLKLGMDYVAGIGGDSCDDRSIIEWPTLTDLGSSNVDFLRTLIILNQTDPTFCAASTVLLLPSLVAALVTLTTVALV